MVCAARKLQALYHIRPADGIGPGTVSWSVWRAALNGAWTDSRSTLGRFQSLGSLFNEFFWGRPRTKHLNTKHLNCHSFETFAAVKRLGPTASPQTHANVKRTASSPDTRLTSHCRAESRAAQVRLATLFAFHGAVQIIARSSPTHCLERRLVRFLRLHRATLCCADFRV